MAKRPVPKYDFKAFGAAIKAARTGRKESRKESERRNVYLAALPWLFKLAVRKSHCAATSCGCFIIAPVLAFFLLARCAPQNLLDISLDCL